jgi:hypothetical protein
LGIGAPGELREIVVSYRVVGVLLNVPGQFFHALFQPSAGVAIDAGTVTQRGVISGAELQILIAGESGIAIVAGILCGSRESQQNIGAFGGFLPGLGQNVDPPAGVLAGCIHAPKLKKKVYVVRPHLGRNL